MTFNASVVAHSKSPDGLKVCTFEVTYPRAIHCSMIAHCLSSRMSLSVRATSSSIVLTGTEFDDFYALLDNSDAEEGLSTIVRLMREAHKKKMPKELKYGDWHLPYVDWDEFETPIDGILASAARTGTTDFEHQVTPFSKGEMSARRTMIEFAEQHLDGLVYDEDITKQEREVMLSSTSRLMFSGNLRGFTQYRK